MRTASRLFATLPLLSLLCLTFQTSAVAQGPLTNGANVTGSITGNQTNTWTFNATTGEPILIGISNTGANAASFIFAMTLYGPDGNSAGVGGGASLGGTLVATATLTGSYSLVVSNYFASAAAGSYILTLVKPTEPFVVSAGDEGGPMVNGGNYTGATSYSDFDPWTFRASAGDVFLVGVSQLGTYNSSFDPMMRVYGPNGSLLTNADIVQTLLKETAPLTGTYTVVVSNAFGNANQYGSYSLNVAIPSKPYIVSAGDDGGPMNDNQIYSGTIAGNDLDQWSFNALVGDSISLTLTDIVSNPLFTIELYDPHGALIGTKEIGESGHINFIAAIPGTYTAVVYFAVPFGRTSSTGNYQISVSGATGTPGSLDMAKTLGYCPACAAAAARADSTGNISAGDPITLPIGNLFEHVTDYSTVGANPLAFVRYYNSQSHSTTSSAATTLGVNWRSNYDRYLHIGASTVTAERPDGRVITFTLDGTAWTSDTDVDATLTSSGATWTLTDSNDTVETYAASGSLATLNSIKLRNGYTQTMTYTSGQLTRVTDSYGRALTLAYTGGQLTDVTTPDSLVLTYGYAAVSGSSRLTTVSYNTSPVTSQAYLYEDASSPFALTGITDEDGNRYATWSYDAQGRATSSQHAGGADLTQVAYDDATGDRTVKGPLGDIETYKFTTLQGMPKVTEIDRAANGSIAASSRLFTYDANGYLASAKDWNGDLTTFTNTSHGLPTTIVEASGSAVARTTMIAYDSTWPRLPHTVTTPGLTTAYSYDAATGDLLTKTLTDTTTTTVPYATGGTQRVWTYTWANGELTSVKGPRTDVTQVARYGYDGTGALTQTTNALGQVTQVTQHSPGGLPQTTVDANGVKTQLTYDARLRLTSSTVNTGAGARTTSYGYDAAGNLVGITQPDGATLTNSYDAAHRPTAVTDLFNQKIAYTLDALGDRTQTNVRDAGNTIKRTRSDSFDALGRLVQDTGGAGQATRYAYDANGNPISVTDPLGRVTGQAFDALNRPFKTTDALGGITLTSFDAHDRPLSVTAANGAVTAYIYDGFGDLIQTVSPDSGRTVYHDDLAGNLTQKLDATGALVNYAYDAGNRVTKAVYPNDPAENVAYVYDQAGHGFGVGRLTSVTDAVGTLSQSFDERGNLLSATRSRSAVTLLTSYGYDAASRVATITYPSGTAVSYSRDAMGRIKEIAARPNGAPSAQPVLSTIGYEPFGPVDAFSYGNGIAATRGFDLDYRLTNLVDGGIQNLAYAYNAANDVLSITDAMNGGNSQSLGYDALDRLTSANGVYGTLGYTYDPVGNRLTQTANEVATTYTYAPQSNRLTQIRTGTTLQALSYTPAGNVTTFANVPSTRPATGIAYNQAGRLATVLAGGQQPLQYGYDAFGQRLLKVGAVTALTLYQYDQRGHLLETTDVMGHPQVDYIYLRDKPVATVQASDGKVYFLHDDRLGTPQRGTSSTQALVWTADYQPFGYTSTTTGLIAQDLRLPGQEFEIETGWNHNGFRDYAPWLGRYLESDPVGLAGGVNTYGYVDSNPLVYTDLQGEASSLLETLLNIGSACKEVFDVYVLGDSLVDLKNTTDQEGRLEDQCYAGNANACGQLENLPENPNSEISTDNQTRKTVIPAASKLVP